MNWLSCGNTEGRTRREPPRQFKGLPYVGTLGNGADVYTNKQLDPERKPTPNCIYFMFGEYYGVSDCNISDARIELCFPRGADISIGGGTVKNSRINAR